MTTIKQTELTSELKKLGKAIKKIVHKMQKHFKNDDIVYF